MLHQKEAPVKCCNTIDLALNIFRNLKIFVQFLAGLISKRGQQKYRQFEKVSARLETDFQGSFTLTDFANLKFPPKLREGIQEYKFKNDLI